MENAQRKRNYPPMHIPESRAKVKLIHLIEMHLIENLVTIMLKKDGESKTFKDIDIEHFILIK